MSTVTQHPPSGFDGELPARVVALLAHERARPLLERGCTYAELAAAMDRSVRLMKQVTALAESLGVLERERPRNATSGASEPARITLRRPSGTTAA